MDENLMKKLSFLCRVSKIDKNLENDFEMILNFVNKISNFNDFNTDFEKFDDKTPVLSKKLREDANKNFIESKNIIKNFSNEEDQFCVVPIVIEKEKLNEENNEEERHIW